MILVSLMMVVMMLSQAKATRVLPEDSFSAAASDDHHLRLRPPPLSTRRQSWQSRADSFNNYFQDLVPEAPITSIYVHYSLNS